jgi:hypothetical protein
MLLSVPFVYVLERFINANIYIKYFWPSAMFYFLHAESKLLFKRVPCDLNVN